jgi:DNA-binding response OmpR family regulator
MPSQTVDDTQGSSDSKAALATAVVLLMGEREQLSRTVKNLAGEDSALTVRVLGTGGEWIEIASTAVRLDMRRHDVHRFGQLEVDITSHRAAWRDSPLPLTEHELTILALLVSDPGRARSYGELTELVWGWKYRGDATPVRSAVKRLRGKLRLAQVPVAIESVRGFGLRLRA